jgi:23S rRNA pseudoU1915 N3-methylase RlmH
VETRVDELKIRKVAYSKAGEEVLRRLVEEAKETAPDLSGFDKAPQYLEWRATDVTTVGRLIEAGTVHSWQLRWYFSLLGEEKSFRGRVNVTREGIKPFVTAYWSREREDQILRESSWLKSLLGRTVNNWRELVDAIDWRWVLKRVEELADELKPWIGPESANDAEREGLVGRMLSELALLARLAEARRGKNGSEWREERAKGLAKAVEELSRGRIAGEYAERLARAIIYYAEGQKNYAEKRIDELANELVGALKEDVNRVKREVWGVVERVLSGEDPYVYCLARDCADDKIVRKFVAPALELVMLDKALRGEFDREKALLIFGEMYATAVAGDGSVGPREIRLAVGGELGGGAALLRLAALRLLNQLLPDELKFDIHTYAVEGIYHITTTGENVVRLKRILAVTAPSAGGEYLSEKFDEFVKAAQVEVRLDKSSIRLTEKDHVAADLIISVGGVAVKYNVYLRDKIELEFQSTDRSRVELAARLLRLVGVSTEVSKVGNRDEWRVEATTDMLAAGREELRDALAEFVRATVKNEKKAERWLKKLESGVALKEGWPKYEVRLTEGALVVRFKSTDPHSIEREKQRLENMGLEEGKHFTVKMPEEGRYGYVRILREGLAYIARLSVRGEKEQREQAEEFVKYILERAKKEGKEVSEKAQKIIEEGKARGSVKLERFERKVEVNGKEYVVKVIGGGAEFEKSESGKLLLRIRITAEVDGVRSDYTITFGRYGKRNAAMGRAYARADAPGGKEKDAERFAALIKALTGMEPWVYRIKGGRIIIECSGEHLEGFMRYAELADAIERWLEETNRW